MGEKLFRAIDVDAARLTRFYGAVLRAYRAAPGGRTYVAGWQEREKAFREGTRRR
jgi:hypothetical protein